MLLTQKIKQLKNSQMESHISESFSFLHAWDFYRKNSGKMSDSENREYLKGMMTYARHNPVYQVMVLEASMDFVGEDEMKEIFRTILTIHREIGKHFPDAVKSRTYKMIIARVHEKYGNHFRDSGNSTMAIRCYKNALESLPNRTARIREQLEGENSLLMLGAA